MALPGELTILRELVARADVEHQQLGRTLDELHRRVSALEDAALERQEQVRRFAALSDARRRDPDSPPLRSLRGGAS